MPKAARVLLGVLAACFFLSLQLHGATATTVATSMKTPSPTPSPTPKPRPTPKPSPSRTLLPCIPTCPSPTKSPTPAPLRTRTPSPTPTVHHTHRPTHTTQPTFSEPRSTGSPVTGGVNVGGVRSGSPEPTTTLRPDKTSKSTHKTSDPVARLVTLVLGAAVLLGLGGATGLYLTRHGT